MKELIFDETTHRYTLDGKPLISVTQLLKKHNLSPNYDGIAEDVLKRAAEHGTLVHKEIETFIKEKIPGFFEETYEFATYIAENKIKVIESEKMLYNDIIAGTCDLVLKDKKTPIIADIKTTSQVHKQSVSWQLSIYLYLYDKEHYENYKGQVFWFNKNHKLEVIDSPLQPLGEVEALIECERNNEIYTPVVLSNDDVVHYKDFIIEYERITQAKKKADEDYEKMTNAIREEMEKRGLKELIQDGIKIECKGGKKPSTRTNTTVTFDEEKFKKEHKEEYEIYQKYVSQETKTIAVKGTPNKITITLLGEEVIDS